MPQVGFEPMIPVFERAMTVHAVARAATVIDQPLYYYTKKTWNPILYDPGHKGIFKDLHKTVTRSTWTIFD
jgi:hypothetical protein